jgi:hypothetical protein
MTLTAVIILDNVGGNDPEVQMTICMWIGRVMQWMN